MTSLHPLTFAKRYTDLNKALADRVVTKQEVEQLIKPHAGDVKSDEIFSKSLFELSNGRTTTGLGTVRATKAAQEALKALLAANKPEEKARVIELWMNRMPVIGPARTTDVIRLKNEFDAAPKRLVLDGKTYDVAMRQGQGSNGAPFTDFAVAVPLFKDGGSHKAMLELANGKQVPVEFNVKFAY